MVARGRGGFIVTSSGSALAGTGAVATYSASKAYGSTWPKRSGGSCGTPASLPGRRRPGHGHAGLALASRRRVADAPTGRRPPDRRGVGALDHLAEGGRYLADPGLEFVAGFERRAVDLLSSATTAAIPAEPSRPER